MPTPSQPLVDQHRKCDDFLSQLENALRSGQQDAARSACNAMASEVEAHLGLEEEVVFPALEAATGMRGGPTQVMRAEHEDMRDLVAQVTEAVAKADADGALSALETLLVLTQQHNVKEENILYPMCERALPGLADLLGTQGR